MHRMGDGLIMDRAVFNFLAIFAFGITISAACVPLMVSLGRGLSG